MAAAKPLIGVTGPVGRGRTAWLFTRFALRRTGARAIRISPADRHPPPAELAGLIIGGGDDIDPHRYGEAPRLEVKLDRKRDALEWRMLEYAQTRALPVLGICRGAQMLNVFHGGSLHQDISAVFENLILRRTVLPRKRIHLKPGSRLQHIMGGHETLVNSLHNQAVNRLAEGFAVAARDSDGIIQAIESTGSRFELGVQWHPEYLPQRRAHRRIFQALVEAAHDTRPAAP